jgi:hypothetical protein
MRLKRSRIETHYIRSRITGKDGEGGTYEEYETARLFQGEVWPASGKVQAEMYGQRLSYIRNVKVIGNYVITTDRKGKVHYVFPDGLDVTESDGLCLYVAGDSSPDYKVLSIKPYRPLRLEAEKI